MMNEKSITQEQARMLAQLTAALRPGWDAAGIFKAIEANATRADGLTVAIAVLAMAQNPVAKTPGVLTHAGQHWQRARLGGVEAAQPASAVKSPDCPQHPGTPDWQCKPCHQAAPKPEDFQARVDAAAAAAKAEREAARHAA